MKNPYKSYKMKLITLSPIFIGSGEELNQGQYIFDNAQMVVKILDENKFANFLNKNNLIDEYSNALIKYGKNINLKRWLEEKRIPLNSPIFSKIIPCKYLTINKFGKSKIATSLNSIKPFMKNSDGFAYIPGSSIKGAIRTAFCSYLVYKNKDKFQNEWRALKQALTERRPKKNAINQITKSIEQKCFNLIKYNDEKAAYGDIFSTLIIGDSKGVSKDKLYVTTRLDCAIQKQNPTSMPMNLEVIAPNVEINFNLSIDASAGTYFSIEKIIEVLNFYNKQQIDNKIFEKNSEYLYSPDELSENIIPNLCIGGMTGYFNKNIVYSLAPTKQEAINVLREYFANSFPKGGHRENDFEVAPHTIKAVNDNDDIIPLGWCNLAVEKEIHVSDITD